jgi:hypothetical protein
MRFLVIHAETLNNVRRISHAQESTHSFFITFRLQIQSSSAYVYSNSFLFCAYVFPSNKLLNAGSNLYETWYVCHCTWSCLNGCFIVVVEVNLRPTVSRQFWLGNRRPSGTRDKFFFLLAIFLDSCGFVILYRPFWREDESVIYCTIASGPCQSIRSSVEVPQNSRPYLTVSSETLPTWRARFLYLYPPGTGWPSYTPGHWVPFLSPLTTRRATVEVF